tara:strand:+ start:1391 stop:2335 length:945 start_codon:yes stop_codon:yes gene_type:complete
MKETRKILHPRNLKKLTIISGQQRSGKSTLTKIISTFKGPVNIRIDTFLDSLFSMKRIRNLSKNTFQEIFQIYINNLFIEASYGRNLNLKKKEETSIWVTANPNHYLEIIDKQFTHSEIKKSITRNNEIVLSLHNFTEFIDIIPKDKYQLKIIDIQAHPVDQIYSMYKSKTNFKFDNLSREIIYLYKNKKYCLAVGLEDKLKNLNLMQKILLIKQNQDMKEFRKMKLAEKNFKYLKLNYEEVIQSPEKTIQLISKFLGKKHTSLTNNVFEQNIKRRSFLNLKERRKRLDFINLKLKDNVYKKILQIMITDFNKR